MKIEQKMSGWRITDYEIDKSKLPFKTLPFITLDECQKLSQRSMDFILKDYYFEKGDTAWWATLATDDVYKIAILEAYSQYEKELNDYFGERWLDYYLRFNH